MLMLRAVLLITILCFTYIPVTLAATTSLSIVTQNATPALPIVISVNGGNNAITANPGDAITATVTNGSGDSGSWLGVYAIGSPSGPNDPASWKWLSTDGIESSIPSIPGVTTGTVHLTLPTQAGTYEVRFFPNNTFTMAAKSSPITINAPPASPIITVIPVSPRIPDTSDLGTTVATYTVTMSDGSPFVGNVTFGAPNFDSSGKFSLSGNKIVVNPNGPGVGSNGNTTTATVIDSVTLTATTQ